MSTIRRRPYSKLSQVRAELRTRDLFITKLAGTLYRSANRLARATRTASKKLPSPVHQAITDLHALLRELHIIAEPSAAVPLQRRKLELCSLLASFFADRKTLLSEHRLELSVQTTGSIFCRVDAAQ